MSGKSGLCTGDGTASGYAADTDACATGAAAPNWLRPTQWPLSVGSVRQQSTMVPIHGVVESVHDVAKSLVKLLDGHLELPSLDQGCHFIQV